MLVYMPATSLNVSTCKRDNYFLKSNFKIEQCNLKKNTHLKKILYLIRKVELLETHFPHSVAFKTKSVVMIIAMYSTRTHQSCVLKPFVNLQHKRENFLRSG